MSGFPTDLAVPNFDCGGTQMLVTSGGMKSMVCTLIFVCSFLLKNLTWPFCSVTQTVPWFQWKAEKAFEFSIIKQ